MNIVILNEKSKEKHIIGYLQCVQSLNAADCVVQDVWLVRKKLGERDKNTITYLAIVNDHVVSTATVILETKLRYHKMCCHIEDVATIDNERGRGYGKRVVGHCIRLAETLNCYKTKLNCKESLIPFYASLGFENQGCSMYR